MARLRTLAKVVRSKNAGPFCLTLDVTFSEEAIYRRVVGHKVITARRIAELYRIPEADITVIEYPASLSIKAAMVRPVPSGSFEDTDVLGAQQHVPLLELEVEE